MNYLRYIIYGYFTLMNMITLIIYGIDKSRARYHKYRIPETTLILLAGAGGSIGALMGMFIFRHKIRKPLFFIGIPSIILNQIILLLLNIGVYHL